MFEHVYDGNEIESSGRITVISILPVPTLG
jgi:hypothetical protein